ncbi:ABC transporter permease [Pseudoclavibacter endophyticus]|uniref:ABC transporter permease n=1 Tax=Pseudoclavibacter endophyticus TaxID=1778590 RepID=A0A6H9WPH8_9MICO|nr:ABC transporter permease [Pseudoclavibacter endophyticus]KAB1649651.1 ABC transporter permease [Pseudoclavibacter endophyticus]GGA60906.1 ABC transporter permease [Pseudoclavibacter endophyticus]
MTVQERQTKRDKKRASQADATGTVPLPVVRPKGRRDTTTRVFLGMPTARIFIPLLLLMIAVTFIGPLLYPGDPEATAYPTLLPPGSDGLLFGSDNLGRDYLARVLQGGSVSLLVGVGVALLCLTVALIVGGLAGYFGGWVDMMLVKISEFFQVIPGIVLALVAAAILGANMWLIVIILSITMWPSVARIVRSEAMRIRQLGYVESQRAAGFSAVRIIWSDVLPNAMPPILVATTMTVARAILAESALSFLGIGDANNPSWGALLNQAQAHMQTGWWLALLPGLCIFIVVLAINLLGDALNDALNPMLGRVK